MNPASQSITRDHRAFHDETPEKNNEYSIAPQPGRKVKSDYIGSNSMFILILIHGYLKTSHFSVACNSVLPIFAVKNPPFPSIHAKLGVA